MDLYIYNGLSYRIGDGIMNKMNQNKNTRKVIGFPWQQDIGFVLSIVLTLLALWVALGTTLSVFWVLVIIFAFSILQAAVQLLMFMHLTETSNGLLQATTMIHSLFIFIVIIAGSVWVMMSVLMY